MKPLAFPSRLYPIVDAFGSADRSPIELAEAILAGGAPLIQLRLKTEASGRFVEIARAVKTLADRSSACLIINDRADVAKLIDAAGVHLGQDDLPVAAARSILGPDKIIGCSTHNLDQVERATRDGVADYIGFGPIYPTASKTQPDPVQGLDGLRAARRATPLPIVAIGGITAATIPDVLAAGADAVAMIGEIVRAADVQAKVRELLALPLATTTSRSRP
jgi:thiamine-phosphate pyrophosphorylase